MSQVERKKGVATYQRLVKSTKKYWLIFLIGIVATVMMSSLDAGLAWFIKPIINKGFIQSFPYFAPLLD